MDRGTRRRLTSLTVALIVVLPLSVLAARWQWNRHIERDALNAAVLQAEGTAPVPWYALWSGGYDGDVWRRVTATGHWVPERQLLVRKQSVNGRVGFAVMTPFDTDEFMLTKTRLLVLRGWVPDTVDLQDPASIPTASTETVTVTLRVRMPSGSGSIRPDDLPPGQINFVDPAAWEQYVDVTWWDHRSSPPAYFELVDPVPPGLTPLPWPEITSGPHLSYFVQWILIGCTAVVVYVRVFRSEWRRREDDRDVDVSPDGVDVS